MSDPGYKGLADAFAANNDFNAHSLLIQSLINKVATVTLVQVVAVRGTGLEPVGFVDVHPLVSQMDGRGQAVPHGTIHNLPFFRLQGGANAVIMDPLAGDIGLALFCSSDISAVKATKAEGLPGSRRRYSWADGCYLGGWLNGAPTQYIQFGAEGIAVTSPTAVTIDAPTVTITGAVSVMGNIEIDGDIDVTGDAGITGKTTTDELSFGLGTTNILLQGSIPATKGKGS